MSLHTPPTAPICQQARNEPIALIGIGCRFPGGATDPASFWKILCDGVEAIGEIPRDRWNIKAFYDPEPGRPGKSCSRRGGFLDGVDTFDPQVFGISPREAACMDPQQRLLLEAAWEALEDGGQTLDLAAGTNAGVFIGLSSTDYLQLQTNLCDRSGVDMYSSMGSAMSIAANRISYCLNLLGPSVALDTACSSSLVAVHLACRSLRNGECDLALAGGANVMLNPDAFIGFSRMAMLSPDGRCKAFDARANGFVRGEGVGVIVLKPLSAALDQGDPIYAVIRGTATNQDGHTPGITVPSQEAQEAVVRDACRDAGVSPSEVKYVEAHGTGTPVGDPIEANALGAVLGAGRAAGHPCLIGSVKTNIGHLEPAAGIAGIIKVALMLKHGMIPPSLHFDEPNPAIAFEDLNLRVNTGLTPCPKGAQPMLAGINSFGFGGANAHAILESAPTAARHSDVESNGSRHVFPISEYRAALLPLSARSPEALLGLAGAYRDFLKAADAPTWSDICFSAGTRRTHHEHRLTVTARSKEEAVEQLEAFLAGEPAPGLCSNAKSSSLDPRIVFVFTGQGPQWWGMGRELLENEPVFRQKIMECDGLLRELGGWSLLEEFNAEELRSRVQDPEIGQPAIFALQVALAALWESWGITPAAVLGHSVGEVAAAHAAGALSLRDAVRVIFHRGRCMAHAPPQGRMLAAGVSLQEAEALVAGYGDGVSIAALNSPVSVTLSGEAEALGEISQSLEARGTFSRFLKVNYAFHSREMEPLQEDLLSSLQGLAPDCAVLPVVSTVTGQAVNGYGAGGRAFDARYWWRNVRETVRFAAAIEALIEQGHDTFLEIGPHPALSGSIGECLRHAGMTGSVLASLRRKEDERAAMLASLGAFYSLGHDIRWGGLFPHGGRFVQLPTYCWQRERFWNEAEERRDFRLSPPPHPLLGRKSDGADPTWENKLDRRLLAYLDDHRVQGAAVFPAAGYLEMALSAAAQLFGAIPCVLEQVEFQKAFVLPGGEDAARMQFVFYPSESGFKIFSARKGQPWALHCVSELRSQPDAFAEERLMAGCDLLRNTEPELPASECYRRFQDLGLQYGPCFQGIEKLWRRSGEALAQVKLPPPAQKDAEDYQIHPAMLDACFQVLLAAVSDAEDGAASGMFLPVQIDRVRFFRRAGIEVWGHVQLVKQTAHMIEGDIWVTDAQGEVLMELEGFRAAGTARSEGSAGEVENDWLYEFQTQLKPLAGRDLAAKPSDYMPGLREMGERVQRQSDEADAQERASERFIVHQPALNRLCRAYVQRALRQLGLDLHPGGHASAESLATTLGIAPQHHRLLRRYLAMLEEDGVLIRSGETWETVPDAGEPDAEEIWRSLLLDFPAFHMELAFVGRCGRALPGVLRGEVDPLQLIFAQGGTATEQLYAQGWTCRRQNRMAREAVSAALERLPEGRKIRILEIGAGTGGMTSFLLPALPGEQVEYVFTDVSSHFFSKAEQRFNELPFVQYRLLDIERPPSEQDFVAQGFDLILASNVLHATADLPRALGHVQELLAPEGLLLLVEIVNPSRWLDLVFGLTEGWWKFSDARLGSDSPLLTSSQWVEVLRRSGFAEAISISDSRSEDQAQQAVLLARGAPVVQEAVADDARPALLEEYGSWVIFADQGNVASGLAQDLRSRGHRCVLVWPSENYRAVSHDEFHIRPAQKDDARRLFDALPAASLHGVVHLWSLDTPQPTGGGEDGQSAIEFLDEAQSRGCHSVLQLVQCLTIAAQGTVPRLWLITRGAQQVDGRASQPLSIEQSPLWGLGRTIANEHPALRCRMVDLDASDRTEDCASRLLAELQTDDTEEEILLRGEARYARRFVRASLARGKKTRMRADAQAFGLEITRPGVLDHLAFRPRLRRAPARGQVEIAVCSAALNFRDVMKALGIYPTEDGQDMQLGDECAGRITAVGDGVADLREGDEVIAIVPGGFASHVSTSADFVVRKPVHLSFDEAVTMPIAFLTVQYALHHLGRMRRGERVLIHAATGGVGLAALQLARQAGAEIFATAGSPEKRELLRALGVPHVMDSRSLSFADEIREATGGRGVDIVLNSLAGDAIAKSLSIVAPYGRFLEIAKRDIYQNTKIGLRPFRNNVSYFAIDLAQTMRERVPLAASLLREVMEQCGAHGIAPLPFQVFPVSHAVSAFRCMAQARHVGKLVLSFTDHDIPLEVPPCRRRVSISENATYLVTGGLSGFGLEVAKWLVGKRARHLVLMGRSGASTDEARQAVAALQSQGVCVVVAQADVSQPADVARVLSDIENSMPPLRGIIHAAMVLDDAALRDLDGERLQKVMAPKAGGAWNLHHQTLRQPLDFFVMFSSLTSVAGNPGQGNYSAANVFLDTLAHHRRALGLPALTVNWGHLSGAGYVARYSQMGEHLDRIGIMGIPPRQSLELLGRLLDHGSAQMTVARLGRPQLVRSMTSMAGPPRFATLAADETSGQSLPLDAARFRESVLAAEAGERQPMVETHLRQVVAKVLRTSASKLDVERPLSELGLDSLMAVELINRIEVDLGMNVPTGQLAGSTIARLAAELLHTLAGGQNDTNAPEPPRRDGPQDGITTGEVLGRLEQLTDEEVDALVGGLAAANAEHGR